MHIRKLELHGFKSFPDRTVFHFSSGISGVVGPNGCGKSNVVDAVRWALGEQRPKQLRGQAMQDVIFAGSADRDAMPLASVTLHFVAEDEPFPGDYERLDELQVTRRLTRDGGSEYLINHQKVRLRDIQELFLDSGAANPLYSFIEQGRIGQIVRARPEDRRSLIEEAAGISRYKLKRREAEQRLTGTQENLERVSEVVERHSSRLRKLEKQVSKALRYRRLRELEKQGELFLGLAKYAGLAEDRRALSEQLRSATREEGAARRAVERAVQDLDAARRKRRATDEQATVVRERRSELEASRRERVQAREARTEEHTELGERAAALGRRRVQLVAEAESAEARHSAASGELEEVVAAVDTEDARVSEARAELSALEDALRTRRQSVDQLRQRSMSLAGRRARSEAALSGAERRLADLELAKGRLSERAAEAGADLSALLSEVESLEQEEIARGEAANAARAVVADRQASLAAAEQARTEATRDRRAAERAVSEAERATARVRSRLEGLVSLHEARADVGDGVRVVLEQPGVHGVLAELLDVPAGLEPVLASRLGARLDVVVADEAAADRLVNLDVPGAVLVALVPGSSSGLPPLPEALGDITGTPEGLAVLRRLLGGVPAGTSTKDALEQARVAGVCVSVQGRAARMRPDGVMELGRGGGSSGAEVLRRKREIAELQGRLVESEAAEQAAVEALDSSRGAVRMADEARELADEQLRGARRAAGEVEMELGGVRRRRADARQRLEREQTRTGRIEKESVRIATETAETEAARQAEAARIQVFSEESESVEATLSEAQAAMVAEAATVEGKRRTFSEWRATLVGLRERRAGLERAVVDAEQARATATRLLGELDEEEGRVAARKSVVAADLDRLAVELGAIAEQREAVDAELQELDSALKKGRQEVAAADKKVQAARDAREAKTQLKTELEQSLARTKEAIAGVRDDIQTRHSRSVSAMLDRMDRDGHVTIELDPELVAIELPEGVRAAAKEEVKALRIPRGVVDDDGAIEDWQERLEQTRRSLSKIGAVNLTAIDEYRELAGEQAELESQRADLEASVRSIRRTLAQLNRVSRERFRETFERVDQIFREMYPRLVGGGRARLGLTDEEDLLESGVEVFVQPPGKRLQSLTLLSGGETAMVAIALIFSLFKVKPSPFCLLDEVDAPLDEANGARFNTMLAEMADLSQFIVITHNKKTMECVDTLYGVTMTSPGVSRLVTVSLDERSPSPGGRP